MSNRCQFCSTSFGLLTKKISCKMCGRVMCKKCSFKELLVYIADEDVSAGNKCETEAHLAVIRIVGVSLLAFSDAKDYDFKGTHMLPGVDYII